MGLTLERERRKPLPIGKAQPTRAAGTLSSSGIYPLAVRTVSVLTVLIAWEVLGRGVNPIFASYPSAIARAFVETYTSGEVTRALSTSLVSLSIGFGAAVLLGIPLGMAMGRYKVIEYALDVHMNALYATPLIALIPLIVLWVGLGTEAKILIVFLTAIFPIVINVMTGVHNVKASLLEVARAFVASERAIFTKIIIPSTVPYIVAGLRLGIGRAVVGMVVAEFFTAMSGLGYMIIQYGNLFRTDAMFVPIIILMVLGVGLTSLLKLLERKVAPWREQS